ncbi:lipoprotein-anchoring transpeptidase ErfK/SrfK [Caulobacter ginsengisoli]|uniref:Lipoprotein-anchoring transpeptidase ErfK/SrfK n=1 Tax=Caulobacter ginsengisoli TaxID=400775 RepID=A0ABU0IQB3_9CAUL|nr:L,D-transpeptidase [Caulobacter ginsengisoli]MDQ0463363.1 lipoprotein-anchoring transpeptidase ErfK/SrfK [Caulobacter ginsengisoli]
MSHTRAYLAAASLLALAACGPDPQPQPKPATPVAIAPPAPVALPAPVLAGGAIDTAQYQAPASDQRTPDVIRAQVLLDRAHFSPGVIDGRSGENVRQAIAAYETSVGLPSDGVLDQAVFDRLTAADGAPVTMSYAITAEDVAGPFVPDLPKDLVDQAKLKKLAYRGPQELLAEKFHMTEDLLAALNPGVDFGQAGASITVAAISPTVLPEVVASIEVDKTERSVKAFNAQGRLLAFYPASIGSDDRPAPSGLLKVVAVAPNPTYTYDPSRLTFGDKQKKVTIPPGPNSPVGSVWIDLSEDTFGIHGSDEPAQIGKHFSHGCIRLTNWDALQLSKSVKKGVPVKFTG